MYFKNKDKFYNFKKDDLKDYNKYVDVINAFRIEDYDFRTLDKWNDTEEYVLHDETLKKIVSLFPNNLYKQGVLVKASCINSFYNTRIFKMIPFSKHILDFKIDERLKSGDITLVNELAKVIYEIDGKVIEKNIYSFTTKYCCIHRNDIYPIYDKYVDKV